MRVQPINFTSIPARSCTWEQGKRGVQGNEQASDRSVAGILWAWLIGFALMLVLTSLALPVAADDMTLKRRILMPGEVIAGHAEFEAQCDNCHAELESSGLTDLCLDCHDEIRGDRNTGKGFHGKSPLASTQSCNTCHTDHIGRDADIINFQPDAFNHRFTDFQLEGHHTTVACASCHKPGTSYLDTQSACVDCHQDDDIHNGALGAECDSCHSPQGWQNRLQFDHSTTDFPLAGAHLDVSCSSCHAGQVFEFESTACVNCHKAADVHAGKNGQQCDTCHSVNAWDKLVFDHATTDFPLLGHHSEIPCRACHSDGVVEEMSSQACVDCHRNDDVHLGRNGEQCDSCHSPRGWSRVKFDHAGETGFPLLGHHGELACISCHAGALTDDMPRDCASCHAADDPHKNPQMQICATCHVPEGWHKITRFDHDFTNFPLVGLHQIVPCQNCHVGNQFTGTDNECVSCHQQDDYHKGALGDQCASCHSPNAWNLWQFDHHAFTGYELKGAHEGLACSGCHTPERTAEETQPVCGNCHQRQDIHQGAFGKDCGRCHSQNEFFELILQE